MHGLDLSSICDELEHTLSSGVQSLLFHAHNKAKNLNDIG